MNASDPPVDPKLFAMPAPSLRTLIPESHNSAPAMKDAVDLVLTSELPIELAIQRYQGMTGRPLLSRPPARDEPGGAYGFLKEKVFDPVTDQQTIKVGKAHVTGSVVNAIKRKNPFCLLHPLVFALDW